MNMAYSGPAAEFGRAGRIRGGPDSPDAAGAGAADAMAQDIRSRPSGIAPVVAPMGPAVSPTCASPPAALPAAVSPPAALPAAVSPLEASPAAALPAAVSPLEALVPAALPPPAAALSEAPVAAQSLVPNSRSASRSPSAPISGSEASMDPRVKQAMILLRNKELNDAKKFHEVQARKAKAAAERVAKKQQADDLKELAKTRPILKAKDLLH